ncbi:MAG: hypothetical protein FRC54_09125 [bacterium LCO1.1]|uniref:Uncharacterized protein n=1 Tax=Candidatus Weimeria bifida TaxID=2599074 RepID=A0A6N7J1R7_9FIRM|nr:hypothetical protein [Candidatus Weimeria bifida]
MNIYIVEVEGEDYHGVEGADFLQQDNIICIYHHNTSGTIPKLYYEVLRRTDAEVFLCETDGAPLDIEKSISEFSARHPNAKIQYIGHHRAPGVMCFDTIMASLYAGCIKDADLPESISGLEDELQKKTSVYRIAEKYSLDLEKLVRVYRTGQNDVKKLYQDLLHEFGRKAGLAAYQQMKCDHIGPFREPGDETENHEPIIYSDITLEDHYKKMQEEERKYFFHSKDFEPYWGPVSIYEEDEDEFF